MSLVYYLTVNCIIKTETVLNNYENGDEMEKLKIAIGSDHGGFELKEKIVEYLKLNGFEFEDFGTFSNDSCDYPKIGRKVAMAVDCKKFNRGILVCGSGIGMSIVANRYKAVRAALCWDMTTAEFSRTHNDANILCLGQRVIDEKLALEMVDLWLKTNFEGGRHQLRVDMLGE